MAVDLKIRSVSDFNLIWVLYYDALSINTYRWLNYPRQTTMHCDMLKIQDGVAAVGCIVGTYIEVQRVSQILFLKQP